ncbi:hypothetical protein ABT392_08960 [Paucibacter sp. JuS9]|uniref:hypothetical protein n=1 Tax=Paucibacter sp. JuS9 TaxID=3228748 RepID=UPI0037571D6B
MGLQRRQFVQGAGMGLLLGSGVSAQAQPIASSYAWKSVPFGGGGFVDGFVFHPREPGLLYARTDIGGAYRFDAASQSWLPLLDHLSKADADLMGVLSLALDPNAPERLYLACGLYLGSWARDGALLVSDDRGASWRVHELGIKLGGNEPGRGTGERLQVDPQRGDVLLLGTSQDGLLKSEDRGRTFSKLDLAVKHVSLLLFDAASGTPVKGCQTVYAGSHDKPGLYASNDGGASFKREAGAPEQVPQRAVFGPDGTLYVTFAMGPEALASNPGNAKSGGVWKRDRSGRWSDITPVRAGGFGYSGLDVDARQAGRLIASTMERWSEGDEVFLSTNDGASWTPLSKRSRHDSKPYPWLANYTRGEDRMGHWISDLKLDPFNGQRALYGTGFGLWMTQGLGESTIKWDFTVANLEETATLEIRSPSGGVTLLGAMGDVSGAAWDDVGKTPGAGLFAPSSETNRSVDFAQLEPRILARTSDGAPSGGYCSLDGGASWRPFGASPRMAKNAQGHSASTGHVAVSAKGGFFLWVPEKQAALCSRDRGKSWQLANGWPAARDVPLLPVADRTVEGVFYVHDRGAGQILVSVDGGQNFAPAITGLPKVEHWQSSQLICAPGALRDLWLALPDQLVHFAGVDKPARTLKAVVEPWMIALGKSATEGGYHSLYVWGRVVVASTVSEGLFRSDDGGASFLRINDDAHRYGRLLSMTADPIEHGTLYLAPHGRGVIMGRPR